MKYALLLLIGVFVLYTEATTLRVFRNWANRHGKAYQNEEEEGKRFGIWRENLARIEELNRNSENATFGPNKFADLSPKEFSHNFKGLRAFPHRTIVKSEVEHLPPIGAPTKFDWRTKDVVTKVKNQKQCGSCWAFAVTETIESACMIKHGEKASDFDPLSPQQIVDCDHVDLGCNGGDPVNAYEYVIKAGGLETDAEYPYTAKDGSCKFVKSKARCPISTYHEVSGSEENMANVLATNSPMVICVDANPWQFYTGGVLKASSCGNYVDHAVQLVGYDLTGSTPYWIVRNSWGTDWGENGYIYLEFGKNTCDLKYEVTYAVTA